MSETPPFYDSLSLSLAESWRMMATGVSDRRSAFHDVAVATIGLDGSPKLRTVILRGCDAQEWKLRFHTDSRSEKIGEILRNPRVSMHFYDPSAKIQLRIEGLAVVHSNDAVADAAWGGTRIFSRQCYGIMPGPGTPLAAGADFTLPETTDEATAPGREQFCAVVTTIASFEWLYLASAGHRRARFTRGPDGVRSQWLTP